MSGWTPERDALAVRLWTVDGFSAGEIVKKLGGVFSRNAIIGRLHRMGYTGQQSGARKGASVPARLPPMVRVAASPPRKADTFTPPAPVLKIAGRGTVLEEAVAAPPRAELRPEALSPLPGIQPIPFIERKGRCAWPVGGEGAEMLCCGGKRDGESPYCGPHRARGTVPTPTPRETVRALRRYA